MGIRVLRAPACAVVALAVAGALAGTGLTATAAAAADQPAPLLRAAADAGVADSYVVVLKEGTGAKATAAAAKRSGGSVGERFTHALAGYSATLSPAELAAVRKDPAVQYVEQEAVVTRAALERTAADPGRINRSIVQSPESWGQDRVDQRALPLDRKYFFDSRKQATGVKAYVIDDGVRQTHLDFQDAAGVSRVATGANTTDDGQGMSYCPTADPELWGHGTHVAGTFAGRYNGIAKAATIVPVKVFPCPTAANPGGNTTTGAIIAGIDWAIADHAAGTPAVANLSLGGPANSSLDAAIDNLIADGVTTVVAAGNHTDGDAGYNACSYSPARVPDAITVSATTRTDSRASYAYYGSCTDIFAPGSDITSDYFGGDDLVVEKSGTSMASPHVAGAAAVYLGTHPTATPAQVRAALVNASTAGVVKSAGTASPNRLLYAPTSDVPAANTSATTVTSGKALRLGKSIKSPNGLYTLTQQFDGNLVLTKPGSGRVLWATNRKGSWTQLATNGNLVQFDLGKPVWSTGVSSGPAELRLQDDGNLVSYRLAGNVATWSSRTAQKVAPAQVVPPTDTIPAGRALYRAGAALTSVNGRYAAYIGGANGSFLVRRIGGATHFATKALDDDWLQVQSDGNAVLYRSNGTPLWSTGNSSGTGTVRLVMQNDGNLVLYRGSRATWSSGTP